MKRQGSKEERNLLQMGINRFFSPVGDDGSEGEGGAVVLRKLLQASLPSQAAWSPLLEREVPDKQQKLGEGTSTYLIN